MPHSPRRLFVGTSIALVLAAFVASLPARRVSDTASARNRAASATARLDSVLPRSSEDTRAISLAYLERARLGLGSPFRLIDQVIRDRRLSDSIRHDVAWTIVGRVLEGSTYELDPLALDLVSQPGEGGGHLEIIQSAVAASENPRVGEAAVRLAYSLAASGGVTSLVSVPVITEAAAQVRDRVLAVRDMRRAIPRAVDDGVDLVDELIHLRSIRALAVESPLLTPLTSAERAAAIATAPELLRRIELVARPVEATPRVPPRLDRKAAMSLARLAPRQPPLAAMRVVVTGRVGTLRADKALARSAVAVVAEAANEESLVAAFSYATGVSEGRSPALHRLMMSAGVALRAHAQDAVWFAGDPAPSAASVVARFGLKAIAFDRAVPSSWRPFYVQTIASGLEDFIRAVPGYDPAGLAFRVEMNALPDSALAMHDPRTHTIRLSAMTPTGTLAHELAHDVDWQAGRRLFVKSGGYATDRSQSEGDMRLSSSVRGLTLARIAGRGRTSPNGSGRPAEVFARSVDWFVADVLASMGRSNGYLTAIEDQMIAGFAAMPVDAPVLGAASALARSLSQMTFVPEPVTTAYVQRWESLDALEPSTTVARAIDAPMGSGRSPRPQFGLSHAVMTDLATGSLCRLGEMRDGSPQERLVAMAIDARARGILVRRARYSPVGGRPAWARAILNDPVIDPNASADIQRRTTAAVAEAAARSGLFELAPAPFRQRCG